MSRLRLVTLWALALSAQLVVAPMLRWFQGFPDLMFLTWASVLPHLSGRRLWFWTGLWAGSIGWVSAQPFWLPLLTYGLLARAWQPVRNRWGRAWIPLHLSLVLGGTLWLRGVEYGFRLLQGVPMPWQPALTNVVAPTLFWNLLLAFPIWALAHVGAAARLETPASTEPGAVL